MASMRDTATRGSCWRCFFFSSRRRHTRFDCDWSSDVCSSDLEERRRVEAQERAVRLEARVARLTTELEAAAGHRAIGMRSEEHTSELQSQSNLVCRLLLEKKKIEVTAHTAFDAPRL